MSQVLLGRAARLQLLVRSSCGQVAQNVFILSKQNIRCVRKYGLDPARSLLAPEVYVHASQERSCGVCARWIRSYPSGLDKFSLMFFNSKHMEEEEKKDPLESNKGIGKIIVIVIIALIIVAGITGYVMMSPKSATAPSASTPTPTDAMTNEEITETTTTPSNQASMTVVESGKIVVEGKNFSFSPNKITVKKGQPVTIVFKNAGGIHDFTLDEFNAKTKQIKTGESEEVTFTPDKAGSFEFYCSVGNHRAMGMVGTLTVEE